MPCGKTAFATGDEVAGIGTTRRYAGWSSPGLIKVFEGSDKNIKQMKADDNREAKTSRPSGFNQQAVISGRPTTIAEMRQIVWPHRRCRDTSTFVF